MMLSAQETASKWGVSLRYVQSLCKNGRIPGAVHKGKYWLIPADAERPEDGRSRRGREAPHGPVPLLRKSPFLDMTDLYSVPGTADQCIEALADHPETQALFAAEIAYSRGQIDEVYGHARDILEEHGSFYSMIAGGMLLGLVAMWEGDVWLWRDVHRHLFEIPCADDMQREIVSLSVAAVDSYIRDTRDFPDWFIRGSFTNLPRDAHPAARIYYVKHLLISAQTLAEGKQQLDGVYGFGLMKILPYIVEPMISQMVADRILIAEIYLRILVAIAYHQYGDDTNAADHLDRAIRLCLADGLYSPLVEHRRQLGPFLDDRLSMIDPEALKKVKALHKRLHAGWVTIHNAVMERTVQVNLTGRERQVARLASFGLTDARIAAQLHLSESAIKAAIRSAKNKTGAESRRDLALFI